LRLNHKLGTRFITLGETTSDARPWVLPIIVSRL